MTVTIAIAILKFRFNQGFAARHEIIAGWISQCFAYACVYASIAAIILHFRGLNGWNLPEVFLLLGLHLAAYSLGASVTFTQFRDLEDMVERGEFDTLLLRPIGAWLYICLSGLNFSYVGHLCLAATLVVWATLSLNLQWDVRMVSFATISVLSGAVAIGAVISIFSSTALVLGSSRYLFSVFFGLWELSRYPLDIYPDALRFILLVITPFGYLGYVPTGILLGKEIPILHELAGPACIVVGPIYAILAVRYWRACVGYYLRHR
ncbi:ABC transporter permease [Agrobacterium tumefaciens]|uniref:ABC-2 family transporter protein n=1 Tax=Agrobacterium tumefaciens TaxID=358 RepID=UPI0012B7FE9A|nr:ABC-2 family transporter protein [Agrobacterium tumefaciens]MQB08171.1 ABC transporter permease [Agrobacterium tumefaciens]